MVWNGDGSKFYQSNNWRKSLVAMKSQMSKYIYFGRKSEMKTDCTTVNCGEILKKTSNIPNLILDGTR
jgi:hypothetical protein